MVELVVCEEQNSLKPGDMRIAPVDTCTLTTGPVPQRDSADEVCGGPLPDCSGRDSASLSYRSSRDHLEVPETETPEPTTPVPHEANTS